MRKRWRKGGKKNTAMFFVHLSALFEIIFTAKTIFHLFTWSVAACTSPPLPPPAPSPFPPLAVLCIKLPFNCHAPLSASCASSPLGLALARVKNFICTRLSLPRLWAQGKPSKAWREWEEGQGGRGRWSASLAAIFDASWAWKCHLTMANRKKSTTNKLQQKAKKNTAKQ